VHLSFILILLYTNMWILIGKGYVFAFIIIHSIMPCFWCCQPILVCGSMYSPLLGMMARGYTLGMMATTKENKGELLF
jgi:hypothetical protein